MYSSLCYVNDYNKRIFAVNSNIIDLDDLSMSGDIWFCSSITLGDSIIIVGEVWNIIMIVEGVVL